MSNRLSSILWNQPNMGGMFSHYAAFWQVQGRVNFLAGIPKCGPSWARAQYILPFAIELQMLVTQKLGFPSFPIFFSGNWNISIFQQSFFPSSTCVFSCSWCCFHIDTALQRHNHKLDFISRAKPRWGKNFQTRDHFCSIILYNSFTKFFQTDLFQLTVR